MDIKEEIEICIELLDLLKKKQQDRQNYDTFIKEGIKKSEQTGIPFTFYQGHDPYEKEIADLKQKLIAA